MTKYKKFLPVMLVLSWLAAPTNAGQGGGTAVSALEPSAADSCARLATAKAEWPDATTHIQQSAWHAERLTGSTSDGAAGHATRPL